MRIVKSAFGWIKQSNLSLPYKAQVQENRGVCAEHATTFSFSWTASFRENYILLQPCY